MIFANASAAPRTIVPVDQTARRLHQRIEARIFDPADGPRMWRDLNGWTWTYPRDAWEAMRPLPNVTTDCGAEVHALPNRERRGGLRTRDLKEARRVSRQVGARPGDGGVPAVRWPLTPLAIHRRPTADPEFRSRSLPAGFSLVLWRRAIDDRVAVEEAEVEDLLVKLARALDPHVGGDDVLGYLRAAVKIGKPTLERASGKPVAVLVARRAILGGALQRDVARALEVDEAYLSRLLKKPWERWSKRLASTPFIPAGPGRVGWEMAAWDDHGNLVPAVLYALPRDPPPG